jgi:hypothetical protein
MYPVVVVEPEPICIIYGLAPLVETPLNITVIRFTQDGIERNEAPTTVIVVDAVVCDALTVYVPVLPVVPVNCAVIVVPAVTPVPVRTNPTARVPDPTAVTVMVVPAMDAVKDVVAVDTAVPCVITLLAIVDTTAPLMVGLVRVGLVSVLLVRVCVVTKSTSVELPDGSVSVLLDATAAASICVNPEVEPFNLIGIRQCSKLTQME